MSLLNIFQIHFFRFSQTSIDEKKVLIDTIIIGPEGGFFQKKREINSRRIFYCC